MAVFFLKENMLVAHPGNEGGNTISLGLDGKENNKGLDSATLVTKSNPCLPGSVVGEESMRPPPVDPQVTWVPIRTGSRDMYLRALRAVFGASRGHNPNLETQRNRGGRGIEDWVTGYRGQVTGTSCRRRFAQEKNKGTADSLPRGFHGSAIRDGWLPLDLPWWLVEQAGYRRASLRQAEESTAD